MKKSLEKIYPPRKSTIEEYRHRLKNAIDHNIDLDRMTQNQLKDYCAWLILQLTEELPTSHSHPEYRHALAFAQKKGCVFDVYYVAAEYPYWQCTIDGKPYTFRLTDK